MSDDDLGTIPQVYPLWAAWRQDSADGGSWGRVLGWSEVKAGRFYPIVVADGAGVAGWARTDVTLHDTPDAAENTAAALRGEPGAR